VVFGLYSGYVGILLGRIRSFYPQATSYHTLGLQTGGPLLGKLAKTATLMLWFAVSALYLLTAVSAIQDAFQTSLCNYTWSAILGAALLPTFFLRTMKSIEWLVMLSDASIVLAVAMCVIKLASDGRADGAEFNAWANTKGKTFWEIYNPISSFIFAYEGQAIFLEMMAEMKGS
jgi:amino acid permease